MGSDSRGRFVWHELHTTDPDAAIVFYGKVIGWKPRSFAKGSPYRLWNKGSASYGGLIALAENDRLLGIRPHWLAYISVPDVTATVQQARGLGARVRVEPADVPGGGRYAVLRDPQDVTFAVFTADRPAKGNEADVALGDFTWHELTTRDWKAAWEFYRALFGWEQADAMDMGPAGVYQMFRRAGGQVPIGGMYNLSSGQPAQWLSYARVPTADRAAVVVPQAGGRVVAGPMDVPNHGRVTICIDPQGAGFAVHSMPGATATKPKATKKKPKLKAKPKPKAKKKARKRK
jgi:predicted enzyme related to lactoylglutathione lyase